ncbi:MAG: glutathione synthetase [Bacteroidetes bacterium]|nr:MAG: glutathione synthetase [Bacteroidota bacterium]
MNHKTTYRVLALTDHTDHSIENSIYALLRQMVQHERCAELLVASRGLRENAAFFQHHQADQLWAAKVGADFQFTESGQSFQQLLRPVDPTQFDLVLLRLPRPLKDSFLEFLADLLPNTAMINHPRGILRTSNKAFLLHFPEVCPPMRLVRSVQEVLDYAEQFPIVLKPLREYGGRGILKLIDGKVDDGTAQYPAFDFLTKLEDTLQQEGMLAMQFLKNVSQGDKRIIVVDGEIMAASLRLPAPDSWLCNVAQGGTSVATQITEEERALIAQINPRLRQEGILIYGVDTLVDDEGKRVLSEVNTLSIGGFPQAQAQSGRPIIIETIEKIFHYLDTFYGH